MRVGFGYDSHRFDPSRPCILAGIRFPDAPGLSGFSDGDAIAHAVTDAILGAAAMGDIGGHFPPGDERWRGADSMDLLRRSVALIREGGWVVGNVDVTVICEQPRIGPRADELRASLAGSLEVPVTSVSVKGKTNERMGWEGAGHGLAVHAVALVQRNSGPDEPRGP
ncbi:MAG: 2-C-methyl-D-erythritol 2,4-cyclodiphosphate synthase [Gemmatimonadales bacterium]|nr:MAG: 2-C-methyl-D-erythritol 2,4-cyclodiphosphate synthase [Gemmatimonadales bacterium]